MPFAPPALPLTCNVFQAQGGQLAPPAGPTQVNVPCALRLLKTAYAVGLGGASAAPIVFLLLSKQTDVRPPHAPGVRGDAVEVPAGSGRFYSVTAVDDVAKGFPNEYRLATMTYSPNRVGWWPFPTP